MRRREPSSHGAAKARAAPSHAFGDARHVQLTPPGGFAAAGDDFSALATAAYEEASTPPTLGGADSGSRKRAAPAMMRAPSSFSRAQSSYSAMGSTRRMPMGLAASLAASGSGRAPPTPPLSARAIAALNLAADVIFSLCLAVAAVSRANLVSFYYLLVFCYGTVFSLQSRAVTLLTLLVALFACAGHAASIFVFKNAPGASMTTAESIADLFGFSHMAETKDFVVAFTFDALVLAASAVHLFYTLRRLADHRDRLNQQQEQQRMNEFDLFEMGEHLFNHGDKRRDRKRSLLQGLEGFCALLLLISAVSVPAFATGVYYLLLIALLIRYTVFTEKVTLGELAARAMAATASASMASRPAVPRQKSTSSMFFGPRAAKVLLLCCVLFISVWYLSQMSQARTQDTLSTTAAYCGFGDLRGDDVAWQYYVLAGCQFLLLLCSAKLYNLHKEMAETTRNQPQPEKPVANENAVRGSMRSIYSNAALDLEVVEFGDGGGAPYHRLLPQDEGRIDVQELIKTQSFAVRMFVREGGLLFGCAAAIVWSVSYPSYASSVLMGIAFLTLALYGMSPSSMFASAMVLYGTCLSLAEYVSNLTIQLVNAEDYYEYGLIVYKYPILDIGVHNVCLVVIFLSIRMHWRYQDILMESSRQRAATRHATQASTDIDDEEKPGSTTDRFLIHADIRNKIRRGGWSVAIQLWIEDAKRVFFTHLDALVLITILIVALSTQVSVLQIGYLVLAVMLILFFEHRRQFWRILLLYALAACFAVFIRNVECKPDDTLDLIGLECYSSEEYTWKSLWPTLFSAQLLIIFELIFQLVIYVANKDTIEERMRMRDQDRQNPLYFVSRLMIELDNWFRIFGVIFCYVAFIVVAIQYEQGTTRLNTTVIGGIQLILCFILLGNHLGGFPTAPRTSLRLKLLWSIALLVEIIILVSRYLYQFSSIANKLNEYVFTSSFMTAKDVGYEVHTGTGKISSLFVYLLPTTIVMSLCFWQLYSMMRAVQPYEFFTSGQSRAVDRIRLVMDTIKQVMISFSATTLVVVAMYVAIDEINFIGWLYVIVIVLGRPVTGAWKSLWRPLFWISACAAVLKYVIQLSVFNVSESTENGEHVLFSPGDDSDWIGTIRLFERYSVSVGAAKLWSLLSNQLVIMLVCFFQRMAEYWDSASSMKRQRKLAELTAQFELDYARRAAEGFGREHRTSSCEADDDEDDNKDRFGAMAAFDEDSGGKQGEGSKLTHAQWTATVRSIGDEGDLKAVDSLPLEEQKDFFGCLREFATMYASKASVNVTTLLLTISCFVHQDFISVVYMLIVYGMMYAYPSTVCRRWWALAIMLSLVITLEYSVVLWLPPFLDIDMATTVPWSFIPDDYEEFFLMSDQHVWALMSDFVTLYTVYLLPASDKFKSKEEPAEVINVQKYEAEYAASGVYDIPDAHFDDMLGLQEDEHYAALAKSHPWYIIESVVVTNWLPLVLLLVFVFGSTQGGIVSIVYLWASMTMLYRIDETRAPMNPWIHYLRKFNWGHLFVIVLLNSPYISDKVNQCLLTSSQGVTVVLDNGDNTTSTVDTDCMTVTNLLGVTVSMPYGLIAMCVFISIQCEILVSPTYPKVLALIWSDQERAPMRREEIVREYFRQRTAKWYGMKKDKNAAIQRLKMIVSKLVHKVEELMDIAMGLHHNLPPTAPTKPVVVECTQNSATISWEKPTTSFHKIRFYRISRQRYPSLTLLGDFSDIVEVSGNVCEATIEGLRPGTAYQFKVCAVSRMGEGPFSSASDPISTKSLNLDGSTTAGWMKYRREAYPPSRWVKLVAWLKPKFLHRYVVIDSSHLIYYRDEEMALKHRSRARRKRLKTSFKWRDVITFRLSDGKVQYDDMSPLLHCLEIVVRHSKGRGDTLYAFQPEMSKEFNMFLSAVAFAVPRDALDDSVVDMLRARKLPNPLDIVPPSGDDGDTNFDENKSEWSSVTGDESTLGDPEDHEFDENPNKFAWRIPLYNFLYKCQNAAFRSETTEYDPEDVNEPTVIEIIQLAVNLIRSSTCFLTCVVMVVCFACQADLLNLVLVCTVFCYIIVENPRPSPFVWLYLMKYVCGCLALRYLFQLSIFCTGMTESGYYYPSFQPYCTSESDVTTNAKTIQPNVLLGLYKFDGLSINSVTSVYDGLQWDFYVLLFILWHQRELMLQGFWLDVLAGDKLPQEDMADERFQSEAMRNFRASMNSSRDSVDDAFMDIDERQLTRQERQSRKDRVSKGKTAAPVPPLATSASVSSMTSSRRGARKMDSLQQSFVSTGSTATGKFLAAEMLEEIQAQEIIDEEARKSAAIAAAEQEVQDSKIAKPVVRHDDDGDDDEHPKDDIVSEQVDADDDGDSNASKEGDHENDHEDVGFLSRKKKSWMEEKYPRLHAYFHTVICSPPPKWDKDIHAAITGEKPGSDYYSASLAVLLISSIFAVIVFEELGEADSSNTSAADANSRLTSSDMISGYLVLLVFLELVYIIWDRVAYVCGSLASKLALQYSYTILLHLCVWWLIPEHTNIYFQQRPALVVFYVMQCIFLWCSALQLRDGYPVYRGSRYNYTTETFETKLTEKTSGLMMSVPFLFEMRALLDYICTRTSLTWPHWVMLEETAAHLFQIKLEMRGRAEEADVLQGKKRQPIVGKLFSAGIMLLFLLICLIGPLALFSSINPSTQSNEVTLTTVTFGVQDAQGTLNQLYTNSDNNSPDFDIDLNTEGATVQRIEFDSFSHDIWTISPPRVDELVSQLQSTEELSWTVKFAFERPGPNDYEDISASYSQKITTAQRNALIPMIKQTLNDDENVTLPAITVDELFPPIVQLTAKSGVLNRATVKRSVNVTKHTSSAGETWWTIEPLVNATSTETNYCSTSTPFCLIAVSDKIVQGLSTLGIDSYGLTAVYVFVVVTIGSAVKGFFRGALFTIQYDELPEPDDVLELVEGVYIAREEKYVGHLTDEVRLFETLVRVMRSPETLIKITGTNVLHIPAAKEKID